MIVGLQSSAEGRCARYLGRTFSSDRERETRVRSPVPLKSSNYPFCQGLIRCSSPA